MQLPTFKGYTVDVRLGEFRRVNIAPDGNRLETISFDSEAGDELLADFIKSHSLPYLASIDFFGLVDF